jgi:sugar (glycoside-pentoside-hexuronide) transporter
MNRNKFQTSKIERAGFLSYFFGQNALFFMVTYLAAVYYTKVLGIPIALSAGIFFAARIWDAVNDPLLSVMVEKANLKGGKFLPWLKSIAFILPIATVAVFGFTDALINASLTVRLIYATVTYIIWGMAYTISDIPGFAIATVMTDDQNEKNTLLSLSRMIALVGLLIASFLVQGIIDSSGSWSLSALILSGFSLVFLFGIFIAKERIKPVRSQVTLKGVVKSIISNKYTVYVFIATGILGITNLGLAVFPFMGQDFWNDSSLTPIIFASFLVPIIISAPFTPMLVKKFGKKNIFMFSILSTIVISIVMYFIGYDNFTVFIILAFVKSLFGGFWFIVQTLLYAETIEYNYYKNGERFEAATFAAQTFSNKAAGAIAGTIAMLILAMLGYQESIQGEIIIQSQSTIDGMWALLNLGPIIGGIISVIFFAKKYDLSEEKMELLKQEFQAKK